MKTLSAIILFLIFTAIEGKTMEDERKKIANNATEICPIKIGEEIPSVDLTTIHGEEKNIREIIKDTKAIIIFYRGGWCPFCNTQLSQLKTIEEPLLKLGYKIIAISIDNPEHLRNTDDKYKMAYELYSDSKAKVSIAFGIAFKVDDEYVSKLKGYNMDIEASSGERHHILPVPSVFLIDSKGIIQFEYVNPNYKTRIGSEMLLSAAQIYN
ncbi:MAG: AhpC/TSA family protein [Ignavibacteriales bacterium]|nr:AhpC/TSA family protein [Ignavibacteriales bacterium]